jgi:tetratricopeptide (TPR) repeat protein
MRFRTALCAPTTDARVTALAAMREADPRWVDTFFFEGSREMIRYPVPDVGRAAGLFALARDAFPGSPAITLALAYARNALSEYDAALALFDRVLVERPTHRDALLGRVLSLSYLNRHADAIRTATELLDLGMYHQGDAYYWRAWNRYRVHLLPPAWDDVTAATKLMVNTSVYTLAGFIAYAQQQLDTAIDRLTEAYRIDATNCEAVWTEALVHVDKQDWTPSSARFATAVKCFTGAAELARHDMAAARDAEWAEALKVRRMADAQKRLDTAEHRRAQSAYNAAGSYARLGQKAEAIAFLDMAAQHPLLEDKAAALKTSIDKLP